jgi:excisionase family DNA binding protein
MGADGPGGRSFLIEDAARLLGVSRRTIYYRIRAGLLQTMRTRCGSQRVLLSSIEALLAADRGEPEGGNAAVVIGEMVEAERDEPPNGAADVDG